MNRSAKQSERNRMRFEEWWLNRTPDELELQGEAFEFEQRYFDDLRLESRAVRRSLLSHEAQGDDGQWFETWDDPPEITIDGWILKYRRFRSQFIGLCDERKRTLFIKPGLPEPERTSTILHEMIHAYESQIPPVFREWLVLDLYRRMLRKMPKARLHRYINVSTHSIVHDSTHGVLYLLKSLDLDFRREWKPGTVFGYGRVDYFKS